MSLGRRRLWLVACVLACFCSNAAAGTSDNRTAANLEMVERRVASNGGSSADFNELEQILSNDPHNGRAHYLLGMALQNKGYSELAGDQFLAVSTDDPKYTATIVDRFKLLMQQGEFAAAAALANFVRCTNPDLAEWKFFQGIVYRQDHKYDEAMELFQMAARRDNTIVGLMSAMAAIHVERGQYNQALNLVARDLERNPRLFDANAIRGAALVGLGHYKEAIEPLGKAYETHPNWPGTGFAYAQALVKTRLLDRAVQPAIIDMACETRHDKLERDKRLLMEFLPTLSSVSVSQAIDQAGHKLKHSSELPRLYFALADVYDRLGDYRNACAVRAVGLRVDKNYARGYFRMGQSLERLGLYPQAVPFYKKACLLQIDDLDYRQSYQRASERALVYENDLAARLRGYLQGALRQQKGFVDVHAPS